MVSCVSCCGVAELSPCDREHMALGENVTVVTDFLFMNSYQGGTIVHDSFFFLCVFMEGT